MGQPASHELLVTVSEMDFKGSGINPPLRLRVVVDVCLQDFHQRSHRHLATVNARTTAYRLHEWADGNDYLLRYELERVGSELARQINHALLTQGDRHTSCEETS